MHKKQKVQYVQGKENILFFTKKDRHAQRLQHLFYEHLPTV